METQDNFKINLLRQYPQMFFVTKRLVDDFNTATHDKTFNGHMEIEALFGRYFHNIQDESTRPRFSNDIGLSALEKIFSTLGSFTDWEYVSNWYMVYDYSVGHLERVRVSYETTEPKIQRIHKRPVMSRDVAPHSPFDPMFESSNGNLTTRVNVKIEEPIVDVPDLTTFTSVRVSVRKYFVLQSTSVPQLSWRFELVQYWLGDTVAEAEHAMTQRQDTNYAFECEVLNLQSHQVLSEQEKYLMFMSLLLKMQDFLHFPVYEDMVKHCRPVGSLKSVSTFRIVE